MLFEVFPTEIFRTGGSVLTYSSDLELSPGHLVLIPLGRRVVTGIVKRRVASVNFSVKPIIRLLHPLPLPSHLCSAIPWLAEYYLSPLPLVAGLMVPAGLASKTVASASTNAATSINANTVANAVANTAADTNADSSASASQPTPLPLASSIPLTKHQQAALQALQKAPGATVLLRGVTGSGKTNIYLKMALNALKRQTSTILLVPEIALTSQLVQVFEQTFGPRVVLIHSRQTLTERRATWLRIHTSRAPLIIIGPRSALLAPVHDLGLIIIDEAHESAYFQENPPRYSALRLASFIAASSPKTPDGPTIRCLLGSATPNVVDYHLARARGALVELDAKAKTTAIDPQITLVDLRDRANFQKNRYFSDPLLAAITDNLKQHHQTLIFHNRRGSAPVTLCEQCGWQALCPHCFLPMTLHTDTYSLACHLCRHTEPVPVACPHCQRPNIIHKGFGTKLLEAELARLFPEAKIARFDGDNKKDQALSALYDDVKSGAIDLLIGTQTLARGLDLPALATVGIIQADAGLALPDFAAEERTFELLTQVSGRVGRGHLDTASVIVQTYQPDHRVVQTALRSDFPAFAEYLLAKRRTTKLPPYTHLARLSVTFKTEKTTIAKAQTLYRALSALPKLIVSTPQPAFHERGARGFTWQIILKSSSRTALVQALVPFLGQNGIFITLDPPSLL